MKCVEMGWMTILVGPTGSGKTSLVRLLALLTGHRLSVMSMNSAMDTTELLGGFEQVADGSASGRVSSGRVIATNLFPLPGGHHAAVATSTRKR